MMIGEDSPGVVSLPVEDGNATPAGSPVPALGPSSSLSPSPSPGAPSPVVVSEEASVGDEVLSIDEAQLASVAPNGGASNMSNNVS